MTRRKILLPPDNSVDIIRGELAMLGSQNKIDKNRRYQTKTQNRRTILFVIYALDVTSLADFVHAPDVQNSAVQ
jgi:hypothetical protein